MSQASDPMTLCLREGSHRLSNEVLMRNEMTQWKREGVSDAD